MSYYFCGILTTRTDEELVNKAKSRWPFIRIKPVTEPFTGIALLGNDPDTFKEVSVELINSDYSNKELEEGLESFSLEIPDTDHVYIKVECWGGVCSYKGKVCNSGKTTINRINDIYEGDDDFSQSKEQDNLRELLKPLGVNLTYSNFFFAPFDRGFFEDEPEVIVLEPPSPGPAKPWWKFWS